MTVIDLNAALAEEDTGPDCFENPANWGADSYVPAGFSGTVPKSKPPLTYAALEQVLRTQYELADTFLTDEPKPKREGRISRFLKLLRPYT